MQYRRLGETGMKLSEIGLGGWLTFGNALEMEDARAVMEQGELNGTGPFTPHHAADSSSAARRLIAGSGSGAMDS
jgi:hypothetical protein